MEPLLHAGQIRPDAICHRERIARPIFPPGGQTVAGERLQLGVNAARGEAFKSVGQLGIARLADGLFRRPGDDRRAASQDLTEDRPQAEDVGPLVDRVHFAPRLLGGHVPRRPNDRPGPRPSSGAGSARPGSIPAPSGYLTTLIRLKSGTTLGRVRTLARPQSITWTSPNCRP